MAETITYALGEASTFTKKPPGIYRKVVELRKAIGAIEKGERGQGLNYSYRGYMALFAAMRPEMDRLGICMATEIEWLPDVAPTYQTAKGGTGTVCAGTFRLTLIDADDGSSVTYETPYVAIDTSDKAAGKPQSYAIKTALFTGLAIPDRDVLPEHDAERPEVPKADPKAIAAKLASLPATTWPANLAKLEAAYGLQIRNDVALILEAGRK